MPVEEIYLLEDYRSPVYYWSLYWEIINEGHPGLLDYCIEFKDVRFVLLQFDWQKSLKLYVWQCLLEHLFIFLLWTYICRMYLYIKCSIFAYREVFEFVERLQWMQLIINIWDYTVIILELVLCLIGTVFMNTLWWALEIPQYLKCIKLVLHLLAYMINGLQLQSFNINQPNMFYLQGIYILAYFLCNVCGCPVHCLLLRLANYKYFSVKPWCFFHRTMLGTDCLESCLEKTSGGHLAPPLNWIKNVTNVWVSNLWFFSRWI